MPNLKKVLKKNKVIYNLYFKFYRLWRGTLSVISPTLANKAFYFLEYKKMPNLKNPKNFHEKLIWLKLNTYNNNSIVTQCADKYKVPRI